MLSKYDRKDDDQDSVSEKRFYESMFSNLKGFDDGHCIVYGFDRVYEFIKDIPAGKVLEPGCGGGHHSVNLARRGFQVAAMDLSLNGLLFARKLAEHEGQNISFFCGDVKQLPFRNDEFDICFCALILHHFRSLENVVRELARVTRRHFVAFEVSALDPISFIRFNLINPVFGVKNISKNQRAILPKALGRTLARNGFEVVKIEYEDIHEYIGKAPNSLRAKMILFHRKIMKLLPEEYSKNKFLLYARKQS